MRRIRRDRPASNVVSLRRARAGGQATCLGWIAGASPAGAPLVDFEGNEAGPLEAASLVALPAAELQAAAEARRPAALLFDQGDPARPILAGLVAPASPAPRAVVEATLSGLPAFAEVDGQRVRIVGKDEIVLTCGEASITLRRNGKVVIEGTYVESRSKGTNRVKGASVRIN